MYRSTQNHSESEETLTQTTVWRVLDQNHQRYKMKICDWLDRGRGGKNSSPGSISAFRAVIISRYLAFYLESTKFHLDDDDKSIPTSIPDRQGNRFFNVNVSEFSFHSHNKNIFSEFWCVIPS